MWNCAHRTDRSPSWYLLNNSRIAEAVNSPLRQDASVYTPVITWSTMEWAINATPTNNESSQRMRK